jgi:arylsulfatase A-like enzyme
MPSRAVRRGRTVSQASFSVIAAIFLVLSTTLAVGVAHALHQISSSNSKQITPKYLVMLVLDGARPAYVHISGLPNLDALRQNGIEYTNAFAGILESETPSGHAALSTGSTPARDGMLGFNWITSDNSAVHLFDPIQVRAGAMEHVMEQAHAPTIASLFKARYPSAKVVAVSGHKYYAADPLGGPMADYIVYYAPDSKNRYAPTAIPGHVPPESFLTGPGLIASSTTLPLGAEDTLAVHLAMNIFKKAHQQITLVNIPEIDWPLGHVYNGESTRMHTLMQGFDRDLGYIESIYRAAGVLDQTVFVVTADHGMGSLQYQIPDTVLDDSVIAAGTTALENTYSTAGYLWLQDPSKGQIVADNVLAKKDAHVQSVYYKVHTASGDSFVREGGSISAAVENANQYLLRSFLGGNAPDVVAFCTEGAGFATPGAATWKGNHGGAAWDSQHMPLIMSGPGIVQGKVSSLPARIEDIAPTALSLFSVNARAMEGSVLADALSSPTAQQVQTQATVDRTTQPVVAALTAQSRLESRAK